MTQGIYDEFIGRIGGTFLHSHDSPAPECGIAPPGIDATWMQYPSDEKSYSFPGELVPLAVRIESGVDVWRGDCVHPNKYGVASYAKYVDQALQSIAR